VLVELKLIQVAGPMSNAGAVAADTPMDYSSSVDGVEADTPDGAGTTAAALQLQVLVE
jgi:hypothetical protein